MVDTFLVNHTPMIQSLESLSKLKKKKKKTVLHKDSTQLSPNTHTCTHIHPCKCTCISNAENKLPFLIIKCYFSIFGKKYHFLQID